MGECEDTDCPACNNYDCPFHPEYNDKYEGSA